MNKDDFAALFFSFVLLLFAAVVFLTPFACVSLTHLADLPRLSLI